MVLAVRNKRGAQKNKRPSLLMAFCHEFDGAGVSIELSAQAIDFK
ncbi:hypothetical protein [Aeromonas enteropelogenes]